jgi:mRNA interferase RelE/StbE
MTPIEQAINNKLLSANANVIVKFSSYSLKDISKYDKGEQKVIIASIIKRGIVGPLLKPEGVGEPLSKDLTNFTKIKLRDKGCRIIYCPLKNGKILMGIIAVGPRDRKKVYKIAAQRIYEFDKEMNETKKLL